MVASEFTNEEAQAINPEKIREPEDIVLDLYRAYEPLIDPHLWPWETKRWHELVFCLLTMIAEPEVLPETVREVTQTLSEWRLLEVSILGSLNPAQNEQDASNPIVITIMTILQQSGLNADKARIAVTAICEAASGLQQKYEGRVQKYFRKYGALMLDEIAQNFSFTQLNNENTRKAFSIWLQNTLNMPVPALSPIAEKVCEKLDVEYTTLVDAADKLGINIVWLDEALQEYWEEKCTQEEFLPATE
ncbi:hypothetical protein H6G74_24410 [Nostoc spongiaeforme FACHB-130]|uniref:Uncharacterized protein n=1 Tax=Nostoc spongiaeforme FACHB-130 TaxID=1357510 RepID=A0ABR8G2M4_9NOSO|nr:hypothetical protein [Nostoc spongiaeforme]MBD2597441.1 hypothetical protein [Nostoc spongiaeforme FACHB-130]